MNVVLLTQDDPFYLASNIDYLVSHMPAHSQVVACVLFDAEPFGKTRPLYAQAWDTYCTFGPKFLMRFGFKFVLGKIDPRRKIARVLQKHEIPRIDLTKGVNHKDSLATIGSYKPDLLISIGGNQIFKKGLIELAPKGCLNLHSALLPKFRGLMPSFWVLRHDEKETGVSVFFVEEGIDSGPILVQKRIEIGDRSQEELILATKKLGMDAILEAIEKTHTGDYKLIPNPDDEMTYFSRPERLDVRAFLKAGKRFF